MARGKQKPEQEPGYAESFSGVEGEDPTVEGWKPKWLREQEKSAQVPVNLYAEATVATFSDAVDAVFAGAAPDETPADAADSAE